MQGNPKTTWIKENQIKFKMFSQLLLQSIEKNFEDNTNKFYENKGKTILSEGRMRYRREKLGNFHKTSEKRNEN